jgi:8-oxo-dGTP diphosphatase
MKSIKTPLLAVDAVILFQGGVVLIRRENPPYKGCYAFPGGFVEVYSDPARDPRGHVVSICYLANGRGELKSGSDARSAEVFPVDKLPPLAFDHAKMIHDARRLKHF